MAKARTSAPLKEFNEIEEALRAYSSELEAELQEKARECLLAEEEALLRLSQMEAETLKQAGEEWHAREEALSLLSEEMEKEILSLREGLSGGLAEKGKISALLDEAFALLLGEVNT
jgi:hypothetical protein